MKCEIIKDLMLDHIKTTYELMGMFVNQMKTLSSDTNAEPDLAIFDRYIPKSSNTNVCTDFSCHGLFEKEHEIYIKK